jgi:hypothetical protein
METERNYTDQEYELMVLLALSFKDQRDRARQRLRFFELVYGDDLLSEMQLETEEPGSAPQSLCSATQ